MEEKRNRVVKDFKELDVYQRAFESAFEIFMLTKSFPTEERYSLTDQIRRSSRSVYANIAEAWRKLIYTGAFMSKLSDADAEAAETEAWLDTAFKCGYVQAGLHKKLIDSYSHICAQLTIMMKQADKWCVRRNVER